MDNIYVTYLIPSFSGQEKFEDTQVVIRNRNSKKDRQYHGQKKRDKGTNVIATG
jgi:hypothetical protein